MRKSKSLLAAAAASALISLPALAQTRVDTNGEFVNDNNNPGTVGTPNLPSSWSSYSTGGGGGMAGRWDTGGSSNAFSVQNENEDAQRLLLPNPQNQPTPTGKVGLYPAGHSMLYGGNITSTAGTYGLSQSISSTAGKVYWISGAEGASADWSSNQIAKYAFDYGVENGAGVTNGLISSGNIRRSGGGLQNGRFSQSIVATGSQITAHVGMRTNGANNSDINAYVDGVRVYEIDAPFNASLVNGGFDGASTDISAYNAMGTGGNGGVYAQNDLLAGWVPLGGAAGQRAIYNQDSTTFHGGTSSFQFDMNKGNGRMFAAQRLDMGGAGGIYTISGFVRADSADSNAMIGIDPTGGLDPSSASVIWSLASAVNSTFNQLTVGGTDVSGNGITIFLGAGVYNTTQGFRAGGDFGARFDDISVTYTPEPTTVGLLALGSCFVLRRRKTVA